jgi:hypothetical protein
VSTRSPALCLCSLNVHRLLLVAAMISAKFTEDRYSVRQQHNYQHVLVLDIHVFLINVWPRYYTNKHYARVGGLPVGELNKLEVLFLEIAGYAFLVEQCQTYRVEQYTCISLISWHKYGKNAVSKRLLATPRSYAMWPQPTLQETYFAHLMAYKPGGVATELNAKPVQVLPYNSII